MADLPSESHPEPDDGSKAPRPPNSWILYRTAKSQELRAQADEASGSADGNIAPVRRRQADISRTISHMWKTEPKEVKDRYAALAEEKRLEHERKYPNYRYQPRRQRPYNPSPSTSTGDVSSSSNPRHRKFTTSSESDDPYDSSRTLPPQHASLSSFAPSSRGDPTHASDFAQDPLSPPSFLRTSSCTANRGQSPLEHRFPASGAHPHNTADMRHGHHPESTGEVPGMPPFRFPDPMFAPEHSRPEHSLARRLMQHDHSVDPPLHSGPTGRPPSVLAHPGSYPGMLPAAPLHVASPQETLPEWASVNSPSHYWPSHGSEAPRILQGAHPGPSYPAASMWIQESGSGEQQSHALPGDQTQLLDTHLSSHGFSGLPAPPTMNVGPSSLPSWFAPGSGHPPTQSFMHSDSHASPSSHQAQLDAQHYAQEARRRTEQSKHPRHPPHQAD